MCGWRGVDRLIDVGPVLSKKSVEITLRQHCGPKTPQQSLKSSLALLIPQV